MKNHLNSCTSMLHSKAGFSYFAGLLALASTALTGCGPIASTASSVPVAMSVQGSVADGSQPIQDAQIQIYAAGASGAASAAQPLLSTFVKTGHDGSFSISGLHTCPAKDAQVYLVARGGSVNTGTSIEANNPSLALMAVAGTCASLSESNSISINEVTTVAAVWPLSSYMTSSTKLGSQLDDASFVSAISNAIQSSKAILSGSTDADSVKLRSVANAVASCVASSGGVEGDGSACGRLFQLVASPNGDVPTDTIAAALHIAQNPDSAVAVIYSLTSIRTSYRPALTSVPQDWRTGRSATVSSTSSSFTEQDSTLAKSNAVSSALTGSAASATAASGSTQPATYYVANNGNDSNDGLSPAHPWKTITKVNASTSLYTPGTSILLNRGDVWRDDYIRLQNQVLANTTTTLTSAPLAITGTAAQRITVGAYGTGANPLIDGADPLKVQWTQIAPATWQATVGTVPGKIFIDSPLAETAQLIPQANAAGAFNPNASYRFLDLVTDANGANWVQSILAGSQPAASIAAAGGFVAVNNFAAHVLSQSFSSSMSGLQNVEATPGSWYLSGNTVTVHLADGSDPNQHTIEASHRPFGVLMMSVNYVTVQNLSVERTLKGGIIFGTFSDSSKAGHYYTNEYNSILNSSVWNWGDIGLACLPQANGCNGTAESGIMAKAFEDGLSNGEALRGINIVGNYVGKSDRYFGLRGMAAHAGLQVFGVVGAHLNHNRIVTVNSACLSYAATDNVPNNNGGDVSYNYCGNNQNNINVSSTTGARIHHNVAANSFGSGIQIGGNDTNILIDHNLIYNLEKHASTVGFDGIDCNHGAENITETNNTIVGVWGQTLTMEEGCNKIHIMNNVLAQVAPYTGGFYWWDLGIAVDETFTNNLYNIPTLNVHPWGTNRNLAAWEAFSGETGSRQANPQFVNPSIGDYRLKPHTIGTGLSIAEPGVNSGSDLGANMTLASVQ